MAEKVLELENVVKRFQGVTVVDGIDLEVDRGEFIAFVGPSGCGKTTTLRLIAGLEIPTEGKVRINGLDVTNAKPWERQTPIVWQNFALFPFLNVRQNVEFGLRGDKAKSTRSSRVDEMLDLLGILDLADRDISQLSGGQKQRVSAGSRDKATRGPARRANERLGCQPQNSYAVGPAQPAKKAEHHIRLCDSQSIRGIRDGGPGRGDEQGSYMPNRGSADCIPKSRGALRCRVFWRQ
jgi:predicted ABC-type transport system involved in lysophospholipase L1 biosynthesis ATPase subunit